MNGTRAVTTAPRSAGRLLTRALTLAAVAVVVTGCGSATEEDVTVTTTSTVPATSTPTSSSSSTSPSPTTSPSEVPPTQAAPAATVTEGAECGPRGAQAAFADGTTAYCARLQYTDGAAWSRDPNLAPNPAVQAPAQQPTQPSGPQIGDFCIGADIGRTAVDANGNAIVCDNYAWVLDVGQTPKHPWVDEQVKWTECLETNTVEECRLMLN